MEQDEVFQVGGTTLGPIGLELRYTRSRMHHVPPAPPPDPRDVVMQRLCERLDELELSWWGRLMRRLSPLRVTLFRATRQIRRLFSRSMR